jgi:hypothetical protein
MLAVAVSGVAGSGRAAAQDHPRPRPEGRVEAPRGAPPAVRGPVGRPAFDGRGQVLDGRYNHGRYYAPIGSVRPALPPGYRPYFRGSDRFYFSGGEWYAPRGPGFVVVRPPPGLVISVLPPYYSTLWFGGVPYYYADNTYYTWQQDQGGYAVVDPPDGADAPSAPPPDNGPAQSDLIIYPKNGQSKDQQAADQFECHTWAKGQSGFDPTQAGGGPSGGDASRNNYDRAMSACLQGRGYQVN